MGQALGIVTAVAQLGLESLTVRPDRYMGPFRAQVVVEEQHVDELEITDHPVETGARITDHAFLRPAEVTIRCSWSNSPTDNNGGGIGGYLSGLVGAARGTLQGASNIVNGIARNVPGFPGIGAAQSALATIPGMSSANAGAGETQAQQVYENFRALQRSRVPVKLSTGKRIYTDMLVKTLRVTTNKESENMLDMTATFRQVLIVSTRVVSVGAPASAQATPSVTAPTVDKGTKAVGAASFPVADQAKILASTLPSLPSIKVTP